MSGSDFSSSNALIIEAREKEESLDAYGRQYIPYQDELLVKSAESLADDEEWISLNDAAQDDGGICPSQLRDRYDGTATFNEW